MELTEKELRERGIRRSGEEVEEDARRFALHIIALLPTGRWVTEPAREFSQEEAVVLEEGGLDLSPPAEEEADPLARTAARSLPCSLPPSPPEKPPNYSGPARAVCAKG